MTTQPKSPGRPSLYNDDLAIRICEEIAQGGILHRMCQRDDMPDHSTLYRWLESNDQFRDLYSRARERQATHFADEIIDIVDNEPDANKARVRMDARKWHAAKTAPKKYGDRIMQEHTGADGAALKVQAVSPLEEIEARLARLNERQPRDSGTEVSSLTVRRDVN